MNFVKEYADELEDYWNEGELIKYASKVAYLYDSLDNHFVSRVMMELKIRLDK